jgi:hypothetical protein
MNNWVNGCMFRPKTILVLYKISLLSINTIVLIGRNFFNSSFLAVIKIGINFAIFSFFGTTSVSIDLFKNSRLMVE